MTWAGPRQNDKLLIVDGRSARELDNGEFMAAGDAGARQG